MSRRVPASSRARPERSSTTQRAHGSGTRPRRVLAVASGGGHWVQLLRLRPAFAHHDVVFVTVREAYRADLPPGSRLVVVTDATRWDKVGFARMSLEVAWAVLRHRPDVVISTGAAPGVIALRLARLLRARTVWVDSIANCEELSMSGRRVKGSADLWLTQWEHLAAPDGPQYAGSVA